MFFSRFCFKHQFFRFMGQIHVLGIQKLSENIIFSKFLIIFTVNQLAVMNYLKSPVPGKGLRISRQSSGVPSIVSWKFSSQVRGSLSWEGSQILHSVRSIPQLIPLPNSQPKKTNTHFSYSTHNTTHTQNQTSRGCMCLYHGVFPSSHRDNISKRVRVCSPGLAQKWGWSEDSAGACCCCHQHCCLHFLFPFSFLCWSCVFLKRKCVQGKPSVYVNVEEPRIRDGWLGMQEWEIVVGILRFEPTNQMAFKDSMYL